MECPAKISHFETRHSEILHGFVRTRPEGHTHEGPISFFSNTSSLQGGGWWSTGISKSLSTPARDHIGALKWRYSCHQPTIRLCHTTGTHAILLPALKDQATILCRSTTIRLVYKHLVNSGRWRVAIRYCYRVGDALCYRGEPLTGEGGCGGGKGEGQTPFPPTICDPHHQAGGGLGGAGRQPPPARV